MFATARWLARKVRRNCIKPQRKESPQLPYELLAMIFKTYVSLPDTFPETLLQVCRWWSAVANSEPTLWTKFVVSAAMVKANANEFILDEFIWDEVTLTRDWVNIFKRRLERTGPSPLQIFIFQLCKVMLPVIDVISGGAPDYIHLPRWETLHLCDIHEHDYLPNIANLISQPMPCLKCLTLERSKTDSHTFPSAPNLEELNVLYCRSPLIGQNNSFPNLKTIHITYPSKYPLCTIELDYVSLRTLETLIIGGDIDVGRRLKGTFPSLSTLEFTDRVPDGVSYMSAPGLRRLVLRQADLFCFLYPRPFEPQRVASHLQNRGLLENLARTFPTVEVLEVHKNLKGLVLEMLFGNKQKIFPGLKELWVITQCGRENVDLM